MQIVNVIPRGLGKRWSKTWRTDTATTVVRGGWRALRLLGLLLAYVSGAGAQASVPTEYQVKAAFLYNFAKFVEWPASRFPSAAAPLKICVFGQNPFGEGLREITREKMVNGRKIEVSDVADVQQAKNCHVLFIAWPGRAQMRQILESLHGAGILTVGDSKSFIEQGGMINFVLENERVQFEVNPKAADQAGLKISSKLLSVAKSVRL